MPRDHLWISVALACAALLWATAGQAQPSGRLTLQTTAEKEVIMERDGEWIAERVPVVETNPMDVIVYTITYTNAGDDPITDASIIDPIPDGTAYVIGSAVGQDVAITYSVDSGRSFWPPPIFLDFRREDGSVERRAAPADSYTHVRWLTTRPVLPGQSGRVSLKVTVK